MPTTLIDMQITQLIRE